MSRHGRSIFNVDGVINGDPALDRGLDPSAIPVCEAFAEQFAASVQIDLCVVLESSCARSRRPRIALGHRDVPRIIDPGLNDVRIGELDGKTLDAYRDWKHGRSRDDPFPGGESLNDAARRYADAFERLLGRPEEILLVVCHEIPVRYAVNAAAGSPNLDAPLHDIPNATPYPLRRTRPRTGDGARSESSPASAKGSLSLPATARAWHQILRSERQPLRLQCPDRTRPVPGAQFCVRTTPSGWLTPGDDHRTCRVLSIWTWRERPEYRPGRAAALAPGRAARPRWASSSPGQ